jgi:hypothetical protein
MIHYPYFLKSRGGVEGQKAAKRQGRSHALEDSYPKPQEAKWQGCELRRGYISQ